MAKIKKSNKTNKTNKTNKSDRVYRPKIKIIGIGGGGGSIINEIAPRLKRLSFTVANTDAQALEWLSKGIKRFQFGSDLTRGLGCGMNPNLGRLAAQKEKKRIVELFNGIDLCILVSCLGGGTGSGAAPVFAEILEEQKCRTLGVFTLPFKFEGEKKLQLARASLEKLIPNLNAVTVFPNEKIFQLIDQRTPLKSAFSTINKALADGLEGLVEMIYLPGLINIDFADLKMVLEGKGEIGYLNSVEAAGPNRAEDAAKSVLYNPLSEYNIRAEESATQSLCSRLIPEKLLFNITSSKELKMKEVEHISRTISNYNKQSKIVFGVSYGKNYDDKLRLTLLATGKREAEKKPKKKVAVIKRTLSQPKSALPSSPVPPSPEKKISDDEAKPGSQSISEKNKEKPKKKTQGKSHKKNPGSASPELIENVPEEKQEQNNEKLRKNALDLRKEAEHAEKKLLAQEKKWDPPAFLRRKNGEKWGQLYFLKF